MGAWGTGLYSDDFALDVKNDLLSAINSGTPYREAFEKIKETYLDGAYDDDSDIPVFWFVCADILWKKGRLDEDIKQTALAYLESETDIARWAEESPVLGRKRKGVLEKLKLKLQSPQPEAKPIRVKKLYKCPWNIGDVYAFQILDEYAEEEGFNKTYVIFQVASMWEIPDSGVYPIVRFMLTRSQEIPTLDHFSVSRLIPAFDNVYATKLIGINYVNTKKFIFLGNCAVKSKDDDYGIHLDDEIDKFRKLSMCNFKFMIPQLIKDYIREYGNR